MKKILVDHMICRFCHQDTPTELLYAIHVVEPSRFIRTIQAVRLREIFGVAPIICQNCIDQISIPTLNMRSGKLNKKDMIKVDGRPPKEITNNFRKIIEESQNIRARKKRDAA